MRTHFVVLACVMLFCAICTAYDPNDYVPCAIGNQWVTLDSSASGMDTVVSLMVDTVTINTHLTYIMVETGDTSVDTSWFSPRETGFYIFTKMGDDSDYTLMEMLMCPNPFTIGDEWIIYHIDTTWTETPYTYHIIQTGTQTAELFEDVIVPAGRFDDCIKLVMSTFYEVEVSMGGTVVYSDSGHNPDSYNWLASGVGMVKSIETEVTETTSTTTSSVLLSYSVTKVPDKNVPAPKITCLAATPNPFNSIVKISAPDGAKIEILDINGRVISELAAQNECVYWSPDATIGSGIYFVKSTAGEKITTIRIVYMK